MAGVERLDKAIGRQYIMAHRQSDKRVAVACAQGDNNDSASELEQEKDILPDVESMVKSFKIAEPPAKRPEKPDAGKGK